MLFLVWFSIVLKLSVVFCVPPSPSDGLLEDVRNIKKELDNLAGLAEKWSVIYATQVEPRIVSTATMMTGIDSNVKNLQERAHVWDTFQLHVTSWNEQMSTADRKLDIISKGQEKLLILDGKINTIQNIEHKLESLLKKVDETQEAVLSISKKLEGPTYSRDSLFGEFATRGILSTLKQVERKLDRVQLNSQVAAKPFSSPEDDMKGKLTIKCNTPPIVEELLTDMSSKVDLIFDKMSGKYEDEFEGDEYVDDLEGNSSKVIRDNREVQPDEDARLLRKLLKRINQPCKDCQDNFMDVKRILVGVDNNTVAVLENQEIYFNKYIRQCGVQRDPFSENISLKLDHLLNYINFTETTNDRVLDSQFMEQRKHFESVLERYFRSYGYHHRMDGKGYEKDTFGYETGTSGNRTATSSHGSGISSNGSSTSSHGSGILSHGSGVSSHGSGIPSHGSGTSSNGGGTFEQERDIIVENEQDSRLDSHYETSTLDRTLDAFPTFIPTKVTLKPSLDSTTQKYAPVEDNGDLFYSHKHTCPYLNINSASGVYILGTDRDYNSHGRDFLTRFCVIRNHDDVWTVIQNRGSFNFRPLNFSRDWQSYKYGFGDLHEEFWFGNDFIHRLTTEDNVVLRVELEDFKGNKAWAEYDTFWVGPEAENYKVTVGGYRGNASDSLSSHNQSMFSTYDRKNDEAPDCCPCAPSYGGGWWFNSCFEANLNGVYHKNPTENDYFRGIIWETWLGDYSLKKTKMMVKVKEGNKNAEHTTIYFNRQEQNTINPIYFEDP